MRTGRSDRNCLAAAAAALLCVAVSCVSTYLSTWRDPEYRCGPFKKLFVFAMVDRYHNRILFERALVDSLARKGETAVASVTLMSPDLRPEESLGAAKRLAREVGADGMLVIATPTMRQGFAIVPGRIYYYHDDVSRYMDIARSPEYATPYTRVSVAIRMYDNANGRLVWSAESDTFNRDSLVDSAGDVARKVADALGKARLIPAQGPPSKE